jgi:hypothetical protein
MIKITQEFETEQEAKVSLSALDYWCSLYDLDDWLRNECKHNNDLSVDEFDSYDRVRSKILSIMDSHGVNLLDVT